MIYNNLSLVELTKIKKTIRKKIDVLKNKYKLAISIKSANEINAELHDAEIVLKQIEDAIKPKLERHIGKDTLS